LKNEAEASKPSTEILSVNKEAVPRARPVISVIQKYRRRDILEAVAGIIVINLILLHICRRRMKKQ
jgi:hypothetical protein